MLLPTLQNYLYTLPTVAAVLKQYTEDLIDTNETSAIMHANKLISYRNTLKDKHFVGYYRKLIDDVYDMIIRNYPDLYFVITGRIKSLIKLEKKILDYANKSKSLNLISDIVAFRIILFKDDSTDLIRLCYLIAENIIDLAAKLGFMPCERLPLIDVADTNDHRTPYFSSFKYKMFIKDYICFPKANGYKSMHLVFVDTRGRRVEIQIRTLDMHMQSELGGCNHLEYDEQKYGFDFPLERERISIIGYTYKNGHVFDFAGVEKPFIVYQKQTPF